MADRPEPVLRLGLLVNPVSGLGGAVALHGSDGATRQRAALAAGGEPRSPSRTQRFLEALGRVAAETSIHWITAPGALGASYLAMLPASFCWSTEVLKGTDRADSPAAGQTSAADTRRWATALNSAGVDLLVFVGGDGTARDLIDARLGDQLMLGLPAGVKMHSGVFATTPEAAVEIVLRLLRGGLVARQEAEVRDIDEAARSRGQLATRRYGSLMVPALAGFLQQTKVAGRESEPLVLEELAAHWQTHGQGQLVLGPGSTCARIKEALGLKPTLLGVDVIRDGTAEGANVDARWLEVNAPTPSAVILSFTRQQGFLLGRGNQQFSAAWLQGLERSVFRIVGSRSKLSALAGRPLLIDTDSAALDARLSGLYPVLVGFEDELLYRVSSHL